MTRARAPAGRSRPWALRILALVTGFLALVVMVGAVVMDWVYDEGTLPALGAPAFFLATGTWLAGLGLALVGRAPRAVVLCGATPAVLLAVWLLLWQ
jgi:hypothetical protein